MKKNVIEQRLQLQKIKASILRAKSMMSNLCMHRNVALYVHNKELLKWTIDINEKNKIKNEINKLKDDPVVLEYMDLEDYVMSLENQIIDYYKYIQIDARTIIPNNNVYVYQHSNDIISFKNIINPENVIENAESFEVIYPLNYFNSKRKSRHFYNNESFKYLEEHASDYEFKKTLTI